MDSSYQLFGFVGILRESLRIILKSRKLMFCIASLVILLKSLLFLSNTFSMKPFLSDMAIKAILLSLGPSSPDYAKVLLAIKEDMKILFGIESLFFLSSFVVSVFYITATVFVSAITFHDESITFKDLLLRVRKSWLRPLITCFYTNLLGIGYGFFCILAILVPLLVIFDRSISFKAVFIVFCVLALGFWLYLSIVWILAVVVSVMEDKCYGIEALGKAGTLVKSNRLDGVLLCLFLTLLAMIMVPLGRMIGTAKSPLAQTIFGLVVVIISFLINMFQFINLTVFYFQCKKNHGEGIELQGSAEYSKLPTTTYVKEDIYTIR